MEDRLIGLLVTLVLIALVISYIISAVGGVIETVVEFFYELWLTVSRTLQNVLNWLGQWPDQFALPPFEPPDFDIPFEPGATATPGAISAGPLIPGGQAVVANTGGVRLNCRTDASVSAPVMVKLTEGTTVTLVQRHPNLSDGYTWWQVTTIDGTSCWTAGDWLLPVGAAVPTLTITPSPTTTPGYPTPPKPGGAVAVLGRVVVTVDGQTNPLRGVQVKLVPINTTEPLQTVYASEQGAFRFDHVPAGQAFSLQVFLQTLEKIPPDDDMQNRIQIRFDKSRETVGVRTSMFVVLPDMGPIDIDLADDALIAFGDYQAHLVDMAVIYNQMYKIKNFAQTKLNYSDYYYSMKAVQAFYRPTCGGDAGVYQPDSEIFTMHDDISARSHPYNPLNREWHEGSHHLMNIVMPTALHTVLEGYSRAGSSEGSNCNPQGTPLPTPTPTTTPTPAPGQPPSPTPTPGLVNHGGYSNPNSGDSWLEGWAIFWSCVIDDALSPANGSCQYPMGDDQLSLENNWTIYEDDYHWYCDTAGIAPCPINEEYAVASLLWDLYDSKGGITGWWDGDNIDLSAYRLWVTLTDANNPPLTTMRRVYQVLAASARTGTLLNQDGTPVTVRALDQIFENHGFCYDQNMNQQCEEQEKIGWAGSRDMGDYVMARE